MTDEMLVTRCPRVAVDAPRVEVACDLCGSRARQPFCPENGLGLVQCQDCGLVFVGARPANEALYTLYGESYFNNHESGVVGYANYIKDERNIRKTFEGRLNRLERSAARGRLLDIGCATGFFLDVAQRRGWQAQGLDVSGFAVQYAREHFGLDVQQGSLTALTYPQGAHDLITMWDVIEHVPDPSRHVETVAGLLRPGGVFCLSTPDIDSITAKLTGPRWMGYKLADEHIYYFSVATLRHMLEKHGFEIVDVRHIGKYVTMRLFVERLSLYSPLMARLTQLAERAFKLSQWSFYVNPLDIVAITARKR